MKKAASVSGMISCLLFAASIASGGTAQAHDAPDACATPKKYISLLQAKDYGSVGALFAPEAKFYNSRGNIIDGVKDITAFYPAYLGQWKATVEGRDYTGQGKDCYFQMWVKQTANEKGEYAPDAKGEFVLAAIDHFTMNDEGKVVRLIVISSPVNRWKGQVK